MEQSRDGENYKMGLLILIKCDGNTCCIGLYFATWQWIETKLNDAVHKQQDNIGAAHLCLKNLLFWISEE